MLDLVIDCGVSLTDVVPLFEQRMFFEIFFQYAADVRQLTDALEQCSLKCSKRGYF